jgi:hypothetical protein
LNVVVIGGSATGSATIGSARFTPICGGPITVPNLATPPGAPRPN